MKRIPLTQGKFALVDDENYEYLMQWKWYAAKNWRTFYAVRKAGRNEQRPNKTILMHREILQPPKGTMMDHVDGRGLNNILCNLRTCTSSMNGANRKKQSKASLSRYKGVSKYRNGQHKKPWIVMIKLHKRAIYVGVFKTEIEAAKAYNAKAKELFGQFARLNVIAEV